MANANAGRPSKRVRLDFDVSDSDSSSDEPTAGYSQQHGAELKINEEYARRFEHNKKRDELQKLEEKYGKGPEHSSSSRKALNGTKGSVGPNDTYNEDSESSSESEDDEGALATHQLDAEIFATLNAIRSKDPRVYDKKSTFYAPLESSLDGTAHDKKDKPIFLQDYHRENLLRDAANEDRERSPQRTYAEEQDALKSDLISQMHAALPQNGEAEDASDDDDGDFLKAKPVTQDKREEKVSQKLSPGEAEQDPEAFLNNFMSSRAWAAVDKARPHAFESDDEDDEQQADAFEEAYNLRFEDPSRANEKLLSHSREAAAQYSVRRDELKGRKRAREAEKSQKEALRRERDEERARLRKLKIERAHEKMERFKEAAGFAGQDIPEDEWAKFLDDDFDGDQWVLEMERRFGDGYYNAADDLEEAKDETDVDAKVKKHKKPKWDDDIDIGDIVPEFEHGDAPAFTLSDDDASEAEAETDTVSMGRDEETSGSRKKGKKLAGQEKAEKKKQARKERKKIEELVDQDLVTSVLPTQSKKETGPFRYRETSPSAFGLSAMDILMADDSSLNQYAGLKKLAAFRDPARKQKDKRKLAKKARLRQWRKDTFGDESGPRESFQDYLASHPDANHAASTKGGLREASRAMPGTESTGTNTKKAHRRANKDKKKKQQL